MIEEKNYEIVKFKDGEKEIEVLIMPNDETVWLTLDGMSTLFRKERATILRHVRNSYKVNELEKNVEYIKIVNDVKYYNFDVVLAVGYRVKSKRGIIFRRFAIEILRKYIMQGFVRNKVPTISATDNYLNLIQEVIKKDNGSEKL